MIAISFVYGIAFGVLRDVIRLLRMLFEPTGKCCIAYRVRCILVVAFNLVSDLVFVLIVSFCALLFTYNMSGGVFRGVVYIMMALGLITYSLTLGRLAARSNAWLSALIKRWLYMLSRILSVPLGKIKKILVGLYALTIGNIIGKINKDMKDENSPKEEPEEAFTVQEKGYKKEGRISIGGKRS